jgi:hypothetical protein
MWEDEEGRGGRFFGAEQLLEDIYRDYIMDFVYNIDISNMVGGPAVEDQFPGVQPRTDNMHDTEITKKMARVCGELAEEPEAPEARLIELVLLVPDRKRKLRALRALAYVLEQDAACESYTMSEAVLLRKMANAPLACFDSGACAHDGACASKLENLVLALSDMFDENGDSICVMGRMTRIYDALCQEDYLVPTNYLEQEIASKCAVLVRDLGDKSITLDLLLDGVEEGYHGLLTRDQLAEIIGKWI